MKIAIDGPAGSGKSTVSKVLAKKLNITYIDTGAMYRAVTLKAIRNKIDINNEKEIQKLIKNTSIKIHKDQIYIDGQNVTKFLRTKEVNGSVSRVAKIKSVRQHMSVLQKQLAQKKDVIMDGRDIGTVILPEADYKFYLTASLDERAKRRAREMKTSSDKPYDLESIKRDILKRDRMDMQRKESPLKKADDAILIDTTNKTVDEVVKKILSFIEGGKQSVL